ncbi:MAG: type II toxin-antitoxin system death-on-curing family toxin [Haloarculaceae archaeon]
MTDSLWYPSVQNVLDIHEDIVSEYSDTSQGIQSRGDIEYHPFVDGNKRSALNATVVFYLLNGYRLDYDDEIREILKQFGTDETTVDEDRVLEYLRTHTTAVDLNDVVEQWRGDLVAYGLEQLSDESSDPNR